MAAMFDAFDITAASTLISAALLGVIALKMLPVGYAYISSVISKAKRIG